MVASLGCSHARAVIAVGRLISDSKVDSQQLFAVKMAFLVFLQQAKQRTLIYQRGLRCQEFKIRKPL